MNWQEPGLIGTFLSTSEQETQALGQRFAQFLAPGDRVLLTGTLGMGKTVFARGIIQQLNGQDVTVTSPTFTLVQLYEQGSFPLWHADLYRMESPSDWIELGLDETQDGVVLIEWPENGPDFLRKKALDVRFVEKENKRYLELHGTKSWHEKLRNFLPPEIS